MREFWKRLFSFNKRDLYGLLGWFVVSLVVGLIAIVLMVGREVYQWKHYKLSRFEWEDVVRYGIVILLGSLIQCLIIKGYLV